METPTLKQKMYLAIEEADIEKVIIGAMPRHAYDRNARATCKDLMMWLRVEMLRACALIAEAEKKDLLEWINKNYIPITPSHFNRLLEQFNNRNKC